MKTNAWSSRLRRVALVGALAFATAFAPLVVAPAPAQAAPVTGFNPGNIISDSLFYNGNAMTASEVQSFLNQRVTRCTIGDPGRVAGTPIYGSSVASKCLRNFSMNTTTKAANANCAAYTGRSGETAAEIITRVGQACGISQKVLLVMLEKEQSLLSDTWPTVRQFDVAMGYACPDSGPGNSANCDMTYAGFFNQVYLSAWQLKNYKLYWNTFSYKPFQNNSIQWHTTASCGRSTVYIENWATAALYIYTPYRPNQAALNAGWGTGDSCSSYGNRNFYLMYTTWFGSQPSPSIPVHAQLQSAYNERGGASGSFGAPVEAARSLAGGAIEQRFASGNIYWSPTTGISTTRGAIRTLYEANGGPTGLFGLPVGNEVSENGWVRQDFQSATGYWTSANGAGIIRGGIRTQYLARPGVGGLSGVGGYLGLPIGVEIPHGDGVYQQFEKGTMFWTPQAKEIWTRGGIAGEHARLDGAIGRLGYPIALETDGGGFAVQPFERGNIYWTSDRGARAVFGAIYSTFAAEGGESGLFGLPLTGEVTVKGGVRQDFTKAIAFYRGSTGVSYVRGGISSAFMSQGGPAGYLGFPRGHEVTEGDWARQEFDGGNAYWSESTGTVFSRGAIRELFLQTGSHNGRFGYPLTSEISVSGGVRQEYQNGTAYFEGVARASFVSGPILAAYKAQGGPSSFLGFPIGEQKVTGDWTRQDFQKGIAYYSQATGVVFVRGAVRDSFLAQGAEDGSFGYPLTSEIPEGRGVRQEYQNATVRWTSAGGVIVERK